LLLILNFVIELFRLNLLLDKLEFVLVSG